MGFLSSVKDALQSASPSARAFSEPERAANAQVRQAERGVDLQRQIFNTIRDDAAPLRALRDATLPQLLSLQGIGGDLDRSQFYRSPEYGSVYNAASSVADNLLPNAPPGLRNALLDRAGNLASGEYSNFYNRLANVGGFSSQGIGNTNSQLQGNIDAQTALLNDAGAAAASGLIGSSNQRGQAAGSIVGLIGALSDERLKENVVVVGHDDLGRIVEFNYIGQKDRLRGRMAQDLLETDPTSVSVHSSGYLMVDEKYAPKRVN